MLFCSYIFLFLFLPLTVLCYYLLNRLHPLAGKISLLGASLFFYGYFNPVYLLLLLGSLVFNFLLGERLQKRKDRLLLTVGITANILLLGYCKYYDFFVSNVNMLFGTDWTLKHLLLPLGISFFTFQQISYLCEIYNGTLKERYSPLTYSLFITFFPQLVAGPIVLPDEMMPQFADRKNQKINLQNIACGFFIFILGLSKKMLLADNFAPIADRIFPMSDPGFLDAWYAVFAYTMQIYFDFSGYCDMAIGIGLLFNISLPVNFSSPYRSGDIQEFWRRWHITLGRFLSQFIYIPLGGSRKGKVRTLLNLFITFLISGLWHGASYLFILWGGLHGGAMVLHRLWSKELHLRMPRIAGIVLTFLFTALAWVCFRAETPGQAKAIYTGLFNFDPAKVQLFLKEHSWNNTLLLLLSMLIIFLLPPANSFRERFKPNRLFMLTSVILFFLCVLHLNRISPFIYFNF